MKKWLCMLVCCLSVYVQAQVWTLKEKEPAAPGTWWCFRNTVTLDEQPRSLELRLAADTKYWLWVNGELQVSEGGLKRGPNPSDTYCDVITSLPALRAGENTVALLVWYFGKDGFSHRNSPTAGISFSLFCDGKEVEPDAKWRVKKHPAYYVPQGEQPNYRLAESNIGFDAVKDIPFMSPEYNDKKWKKATEISLEKAGWNQLVNRPIPFWKDYGLKPYAKTEMQGDTLLRAYLPYNAQITPYIRLKAPAGKCIRIRTDNYRGGSATNVFAEYRTCEGEQTFECKGWMNGHYVQYELPEGVEGVGDVGRAERHGLGAARHEGFRTREAVAVTAAHHVAADEHLHAGLFTLVGVNVDQFHDEIGIRGRKGHFQRSLDRTGKGHVFRKRFGHERQHVLAALQKPLVGDHILLGTPRAGGCDIRHGVGRIGRIARRGVFHRRFLRPCPKYIFQSK